MPILECKYTLYITAEAKGKFAQPLNEEDKRNFENMFNEAAKAFQTSFEKIYPKEYVEGKFSGTVNHHINGESIHRV